MIFLLQEFVIWTRLELVTYCLEGSCSIQLSYQTNNILSIIKHP